MSYNSLKISIHRQLDFTLCSPHPPTHRHTLYFLLRDQELLREWRTHAKTMQERKILEHKQARLERQRKEEVGLQNVEPILLFRFQSSLFNHEKAA